MADSQDNNDSNEAPEAPPSGRVQPPTGGGVAFRKWCVGLGVVMMGVSLGLSVFNPVQSDMLYVSNRAFMALGGALGAGGLIGFLRIEMELLRQAISGGGGMGVFVVLFLVNPPALTAMASLPESRKEKLNEIVGPPPHEAPDAPPDGVRPIRPRPELRDILKREGFASIRAFRVTASEAQMERIGAELRRPQEGPDPGDGP